METNNTDISNNITELFVNSNTNDKMSDNTTELSTHLLFKKLIMSLHNRQQQNVEIIEPKPIKQRSFKNDEVIGLMPLKQELGNLNLRSEENRRNDKIKELAIKYKTSMSSRHLRAVGNTTTVVQQSIVNVPFIENGKYDAQMPLWPIYEPKDKNARYIIRTLTTVMNRLIDHAFFIHPSARKDINIRRQLYDDLLNGRIYNLYKNKYYMLKSGHQRIVKRWIRSVFPDFTNWMVILPVEPHGMVDPYGVFEITTVVGVTYLIDKYMAYQREKAVANAPYIFIKKGVTAIRDTFVSVIKTIRSMLSQSMSSLLGGSTNMWDKFWLLQAIATLAYCIFKYAKSSSTLQSYMEVIQKATDPISDDIESHADGMGPLLLTAGIASIVLPVFGVNILKSYRSVSAIYRDIGGPQTLLGHCKLAINTMCTMIGLVPFFTIVDHLQIYRDIIDRADDVLGRDTLSEDIINDQTLHPTIVAILYDLEPHYRTVISDRNIPDDVRRDFTRIKPALITLRTKVARSNRAFDDRMEPPVVWLSGPAGQGKTVVGSGIRAAVFGVLFGRKLRPSDVWTRNKATEYDDGYTGQWSTYIPEIFQSTLPQVNITDGLSFIQMCDSTVLPLNMSAVEQKGTVNYCSKMISVDTNGNLSNTGIFDIEAIKRRQTFPLTILRKKKIDFGANPTIEDLDSAWELRVHKDARGAGRTVYQTACEDLDFNAKYTVSEIISMIVKEYRRRESKIPIADVFSTLNWNSSSESVSSEQDASFEEDDESSEEYEDSEVSDSEEPLLCNRVSSLAKGKEPDNSQDNSVHLLNLSKATPAREKANLDIFLQEDAVEAHGLLEYLGFRTTNDSNKMNMSRLDFMKEVLGENKTAMVEYGVVPARDSTVGIITHGVVIINKTYACDYGSVVNVAKLGTPLYEELTENFTKINVFTVPCEDIYSAIRLFKGRKWNLMTNNCQDFMVKMIAPSNKEFVPLSITTAHKFVNWCKPNTGLIENNDRIWYEVPWDKRYYDGKYLCRKYPMSTDGEIHFPQYNERYLSLVDQKTKRPFSEVFMADINRTNLVRCDNGLPVVCLDNGVQVTVTVSGSSIALQCKEPIKVITVYNQLYLVTFNPAYTKSSMVHRTVATVSSTIWNNLPDTVKEKYDAYSNATTMNKMLVIGASTATLLLFYHMFVKQVLPAMSYMYDTILHMTGVKNEVIKAESLNRHINFQAGTAIKSHSKQNQMEAVIAKYAMRLKQVCVKYKDVSQRCHIYFLSSRIGAITTHSVVENDEIEIFDDGMDHGTKYSSREYSVHSEPGREVSYVVFNRDVASVKTIIPKLRSRAEAKTSYDNIIRLHRIKKGTINLSQKLEGSKSIAPRGLTYTTVKEGKHIRNVNDYYQTENTGLSYGDCSVPYLTAIGSDMKLLGIHFGGINDLAYIAPIYSDDIPSGDTGVSYTLGIDKDRIKDTINTHSSIPGLRYVATLDRPLRQVTKNKIRLGPLAVTKMQLDGIPDLGLQKADLYGPVVPLAFRYNLGYAPRVYPEYLEKLEYHDPRIFSEGLIPDLQKQVGFISFKDAILGNNKGIDSLDQTTSTGPSLSLGLIKGLPRSNKRSSFFDKQTGWILPEMLELLEENKDKAEKLIAVTPIVGDSLKVEMRPIEKKVEINGQEYIKPRVFGCTDLLALIEHKAVFGEMCHEMHRKFAEGGDMVGINPMNMGWRRMEIHMRQFPNIFGMDIRGCDNSHNRRITLRFFLWINHHFFKLRAGTRQYNRLKVACMTLNSVFHIWKDGLYMTEGKNPSGCFLTCLINIFFVYIRLSQCFYYMQKLRFGNNVLKFSDHVRFCGFGDDNVTSVSDEVSSWFNRQTIFVAMDQLFGIICTAPDKSVGVTPFDTWETIDFLKRKWKFDGPYTWAPLEESSILKSLIFTDKNFSGKEEEIDHYHQVLNAACTEYTLHGEEKFQWFEKTFKPRFELIGGVWDFRDYSYMLRKLKSSYHNIDYMYDCRV